MMKLCSPLTVLNQLHVIRSGESVTEIGNTAKGAGITSVLESEVSGSIRNQKDQRKFGWVGSLEIMQLIRTGEMQGLGLGLDLGFSSFVL